MFKNKIYIVIYLCILAPLLLTAAPLDKYYVPQRTGGYSVPPKTSVSESVYIDFKNKIRGYPQTKKIEMRKYYDIQMKKALKKHNYKAASHYRRLIWILNSK